MLDNQPWKKQSAPKDDLEVTIEGGHNKEGNEFTLRVTVPPGEHVKSEMIVAAFFDVGHRLMTSVFCKDRPSEGEFKTSPKPF